MASNPTLLPRSSPAAVGVSSRAINSLVDQLAAEDLECHSLMVVRKGHVVAEGWWAPFSADRPHLVYSVTKSYVAVAVGLAFDDGLLSLDDRLVDLLPDHVPPNMPEQGGRITVHHLLTMTAGHTSDSLEEAWTLEPDDMIKGFLRVQFPAAEGTRHTYDNPTTFILARIVERVTGRTLPEFLEERLFAPMGIDHAEWDRVASGAALAFTGLHLTTEALAAFGELLRQQGRWGDRQLVSQEWIQLATRWHVDTHQMEGWSENADALCGYGYQFWMSRHGFRADGAFGQSCLVVPSQDLVVVLTGAVEDGGAVFEQVWNCLLPGLDHADSKEDDEALAKRLRNLSLPEVTGTVEPERSVTATLTADAEGSAVTETTSVVVRPDNSGWVVQLGPTLTIGVGHGSWRESSPLGRPVVAMGGWQGHTFVADLYVITTPHRVRLEVDAKSGSAAATWSIVPLTGPDLALQLRSPLMTRPDVS